MAAPPIDRLDDWPRLSPTLEYRKNLPLKPEDFSTGNLLPYKRCAIYNQSRRRLPSSTATAISFPTSSSPKRGRTSPSSSGSSASRRSSSAKTDSKLGGVETHADARKCAELFQQARGRNRRRARLPAELRRRKGRGRHAQARRAQRARADPGLSRRSRTSSSPARRRDSFCGKISVCNNLVQAGIKFTLTSKHVSHPTSDSFKRDLQKFLGVCRVVNGLRGVRLGAVGARPGAFNTVRYSEKILERHGISVTTVDLSEIIGAANKLDANAAAVKAKLAEITGYAPAPGVPNDKLVQMAKMGVVLTDWMDANHLDATAIQCWTSRAAELRLQRLHAHEHDEREVHAQRLRSGRHRRAHDVCHATRRRHARRARGLEQQLRGRRRQVRPLPLRQLGEDPSCPTSRSPTRRSSAALSAWKTPTARSTAARPPAR